MTSKVMIASFPLPDSETYYFWLFYDALKECGYDILNTRGVKFNVSWLFKNRGKVRIVHFHWPAYLYSHGDTSVFLKQLGLFTLRLIVARALGYKIAWTVHNLYPHDKNNHYLEYLGRLSLCWLSNVIFIHFEGARKVLRSLFWRRRGVYTIPHGNFIKVFENVCSRQEARKELELPDNVFVYLIFGAIRNYKGLDDGIEAFNKMCGPEDRLLIVGKPWSKEGEKWLKDMASRNPRILIFPNFVEPKMVQFFFNSADAVLMPYKNIFTSGNLFLAMTFGKPVVAPDMGIISEIVDEKIGIKYKPGGGIKALTEAMVKIKEFHPEKTSSVVYARASSFRWEDSAKIATGVFEKILNG